MTTTMGAGYGIQTDGILAIARTNLIKANVSAKKHFKEGEILRITVEGWYKTLEASAKTAHLMIGHDPKGRKFNLSTAPEEPFGLSGELKLGNGEAATLTFLTPILEIHVPFIIDL